MVFELARSLDSKDTPPSEKKPFVPPRLMTIGELLSENPPPPNRR